MSATATTWSEANQRYVVAGVDAVRARLRVVAGEPDDVDAAARACDAAASEAPAPPALVSLAAAAGMTRFEADLLLAATAAELDADVAQLCARVHGDPRRTQLTFTLAQALFDDPHWSAITPGRPLRWMRLVELGSGPLPAAPISVAERVLHHIMGVGQPDERLVPWLSPLPTAGPLPASHERVADEVAARWSSATPGAVQLLGPHRADRRQVVAVAAERTGCPVFRVAAGEVPSEPSERDGWLRLVQREALLNGTGLLVEVPRDPAPGILEAIGHLAELAVFVVLSTDAPHPLDGVRETLEVPRLSSSDQWGLWVRCLGPERAAAASGAVRAFDLAATDLAAVAARAARDPRARNGHVERAVWQACRRGTRPVLDGLAQRVDARSGWQDLVLPEDQLDAVRRIAAHAPHRLTVADAFDATERGHGLVALFCGPSGTGKTLAAEVIANALGLDLFRVDLASVVSKWVGETEKHLRALLDAADRGSAVLLFDEADALFGRRSEVRDSHDRFANMEVGYLLQRLEAYRGIALLTTNMRSAIDSAFARRIRYVVQFPHPDTALRARIWSRAFPAGIAVEDLDFDRLALLDLTGGSIHAIAVTAALDAASDATAVTVAHVRRAAMREYAKLERPLTRPEAVGLR